jgi:hypothetical protein
MNRTKAEAVSRCRLAVMAAIVAVGIAVPYGLLGGRRARS